ncbi:DUF1131 family protein [Hirschia litorea]|uniref:DUF1131 family protein n=1 Tax=Hirschia litorea TaxID=1199156 RepID=A0ABW2IJD4_9PROT
MISKPIFAALCAMAVSLSACYDDDDGAPAIAPKSFQTSADLSPNASTREEIDIVRDDTGRPKSHALLGKQIPDFSAKLSSGGQITQADLKGRWTIINFWGLFCHDSLNDAAYANALKTALEQDPDVGYLSFHTAPQDYKTSTNKTKIFGKWGSVDAFFKDKGYSEYPVALDPDATIREAFKIIWTPTYLIVGPDLTIEAFRTDLSIDNPNGIKDVVRQIHEIRKSKSGDKSALLPTKPAISSAPASTISSVGVAGLADQTPFDLWAIKQAFDGYEVFTGKSEKSPYFEVHSTDGLVMRIKADETGDWVGAAIATAREFKGPLGETIGVSLLGEIPKDILGECQLGQDTYADALFCRADSISRFVRVFRLPEYYDHTQGMPPEDIMNASQLIEMRFLPPNRAI